MTPDVLIAGGGLAGLAAGVRVAASGGRAAIFESSAHLGGRCYSYADPATGETVDNGQHVLIGAYGSVVEYLRIIGASGLLGAPRPLTLPFHHPERGTATLRLSVLPAPLDLTAGVLRYRLLSAREKGALLSAAAGIRSVPESALEGQTVAGWLDQAGQSRNVRDCFWDPIAVSVMNENPGSASARLFVNAMRRAFQTGSASRMLIPSVGQTALYVDKAVEFLEAAGSSVRTRAPVAAVEVNAGRASGVRLRDGSFVQCARVIAALPSWSIGGILPPSCGVAEAARSLGSSPIVSATLWLDRPVMDGEMLGLIGRSVQWVFDRRRIIGETGARTDRALHAPACISCVISAARAVVGKTSGEITALVLRDLRTALPAAAKATVLRSVVIREKRATFAPTPAADNRRPGAVTGIAGLHLAGDWTDTGLPATIEGAIASGFRAADLALAR